MSLVRKYSKAKANANRVVWTPNEVLQVPYVLMGFPKQDQDFGLLRITGREVRCLGFRVDFQYPARRYDVEVAVGIYSANDVLVDNSRMVLGGILPGGDLRLAPSFPMPPNSLWKFKIEINSGQDQDLPQGITATYLLHYANGPSNSTEWTANLPASGVGYWTVGGSFIVE